MLKILQAWLQQYVNSEIPDVQAGFRKGRGTRDQIANICWIMEIAREFQKSMYFCFIDYAKASDCVDHSKLCTILKSIGIPDHLTCLPRTCMKVKKKQLELFLTEHKFLDRWTDWFQIGKGVWQGCIVSTWLFNLYSEYIMQNAGIDKHKLESRLLGETSITSDMQMTPPLWQKVKKN